MTPAAAARPPRKRESAQRGSAQKRGSGRKRTTAGGSGRERGWDRVPVWVRAVAAGLLVAASMPPWGWWPLGWAGLAVWVDLLGGARAPARAGRSALAAAAWFAPSTLWMADMTLLGWPLTVAGFSAMFAAAGAAVPGDDRRYGAFPAAVVLTELLRWSWPFGGVPIATVAMGQAAGPLAPTARLFGSLLLTALAAAAGVAVAAAARRSWKPAAAAALLVVAAAAAAPLAPGARAAGEIRVAAVQGGGPQNTRADICANRGVFERHLAASAGVSKPVDLVVWPEDVVHPSPDGAVLRRCEEPLLTESEARSKLSALAVELEAVVVAGFFGRSADGEANLNYSAVFDRAGAMVDRYDKVKLVPYGELVPMRGLVERVSGEVPARDVRPGTGPAVVDTELGRLGVSISWEVFFDHRARDAAGNGGLILLNPTNGSSYWLAVIQSQQIASSRLRAVETDRWVVQAAPTGFSAVVTPDGAVAQRSGISEARVLQAAVELREGTTLAVRWGAWPVAVTAAAAMALAYAVTPRTRRATRKP